MAGAGTRRVLYKMTGWIQILGAQSRARTIQDRELVLRRISGFDRSKSS